MIIFLNDQLEEQIKSNILFHLFLQHCFDLHARGHTVKACKTQADGKKVQGNHQSYRLSATSGEERESWVQSLRSSISWNPFLDQVTIQKKISSMKKDH
ncbi:hypothetical protein AB205_0197170 [Aquarana catesbeiana]|uniref:PH domain-containing protein n=1 Tax=Aquarana catesbeiana TaxID=8400 RepID=A0A2G9SCS0_AQUCT|nr:hypothetical protein AB205_0197170 [Aquarana catesbeiana]